MLTKGEQRTARKAGALRDWAIETNERGQPVQVATQVFVRGKQVNRRRNGLCDD